MFSQLYFYKFDFKKQYQMQFQQIFWQQKVSPKELIVDWDKFSHLFEEWILQTISLKLNQTQKDFIKSLIDPQNKNLVYKNSYLLFVKNYWDLPSNRTKLLKGQINLSQFPKFSSLTDLKVRGNVLLRIQYKRDRKDQSASIGQSQTLYVQKIYQFRKNKVYTLDPKLNIISEHLVHTENFLTLGQSQKNDICISDCSSINKEHMKLILINLKKKKEKKSFYTSEQELDQKQNQHHYYIRDISRSNRLHYSLKSNATYAIMRPGMIVNVGLIDKYSLQIVKATPEDVNENHIKQLNNLLNNDRINYLGEIDLLVPEKVVVNIPISQIKPSDIQSWFHKGFHYEENTQNNSSKKINDLTREDDDLPLFLKLVNKVTRQTQELKFIGGSVKVGRNKSNKIVIDEVSVRNIQCEFFCVTGIWMVRNIIDNFSQDKIPNQKSLSASFARRLNINCLEVCLSSLDAVNDLQNSNRVQLSPNCCHEIRGKNLLINISFPQK